MISLFKNDLKQLKNVIIIFSGLILLCLAINLVSYRPDIPVMAFYAISLIYALTVPIVNLHYLFNQTKQTHFASLPFTKWQSFMIHYFSGLVCILVPLFLYCIVEVVLGQGIVIENCLALFLMVWIYYSFGNLTAYLTTTVLVDIILQAVIIMVPIVMYICLWMVYQTFVRGIIATDISISTVSLLMPLVKLFICGTKGISLYYVLLYFGYGVVTFILALSACIKRNCEQNYHGYTFKLVGQTIKLVIIIAVSWIVTSLFDVSNQSIKSFIMINVLATFVVTFVIQFIYSKKIRYVLCTVQAAMIVLATVVIIVSSKDYLESYIPKNITTAMINSPIINNNISKANRINDQASIDVIVDIHKEILKQKNDTGEYGILITYYKNSGEKTVRSYNVNRSQYQEIINRFSTSMIKSWLGGYYDILNKIDKVERMEYNFVEENAGYDFIKEDDRFYIEGASNKVLFKNLLQEQLTNFEKNPSLLTKIKASQAAVFSTVNKNNNSSYNVNENSPLALALIEYHKLKAN